MNKRGPVLSYSNLLTEGRNMNSTLRVNSELENLIRSHQKIQKFEGVRNFKEVS